LSVSPQKKRDGVVEQVHRTDRGQKIEHVDEQKHKNMVKK